MSSRVFISCGQATTAERRVADEVRRWFEAEGYLPHVAIQAQSLEDVNSGIIEELKRSDFYVFIDFRREQLPRKGRLFGLCGPRRYRGSLFTNQELAVAQVLRFAKVIFLQQEGVELEGLLKYMGSNATHFTKTSEVVALLERLVRERRWTPSYSRHLEVGDPHWTPVLPYLDHTGTKMVRVFELDIHNRRSDLAALNAVARLARLATSDGSTPSGIDSSELKVVGHAVTLARPRPGSSRSSVKLSSNSPRTLGASDRDPTPTLVAADNTRAFAHVLLLNSYAVKLNPRYSIRNTSRRPPSTRSM